MQVWLNHSRYPSVDMATYFTKEQYAGVYNSFYISLYPIHEFDVSSDRRCCSTVRIEFSANIPVNMQAYALIISD